MSAPASTTPSDLPTRLIALRLLGVTACVAFGFVAVWQGFGAVGYGTDAHPHRVLWVCIQLLGVGLAVVVMKGRLVRVLVAIIFLGTAVGAWWSVRSSGREGMSLCEAAFERARYRELLATATVENAESYEGLRGIDLLTSQYPSLAAGLQEEFTHWKANTTDEIVARFGRAAPDDFKTVVVLRQAGKALAEIHAPGTERFNDAFLQWIAKARMARTDELIRLPLGDWAAFDRTAPGRKALAREYPETRDALVRAETEWVDASVELLVGINLTPKPGELPKRSAFWVQLHEDILALKSLDDAGGRFTKARLRLFIAAHGVAQAEATMHLGAGRYNRAYGVARAHAVAWNATATVLGETEIKKLDALRDKCAALVKTDTPDPEPAEEPDIAPPPRPKP